MVTARAGTVEMNYPGSTTTRLPLPVAPRTGRSPRPPVPGPACPQRWPGARPAARPPAVSGSAAPQDMRFVVTQARGQGAHHGRWSCARPTTWQVGRPPRPSWGVSGRSTSRRRGGRTDRCCRSQAPPLFASQVDEPHWDPAAESASPNGPASSIVTSSPSVLRAATTGSTRFRVPPSTVVDIDADHRQGPAAPGRSGSAPRIAPRRASQNAGGRPGCGWWRCRRRSRARRRPTPRPRWSGRFAGSGTR